MELNLEDSIRLVTGKGAWHTNDCGGKLPSIHMADGPHGLRKQEEHVRDNNESKIATCFPSASAVACSWNVKAAQMLGAALANEAWNEKVSVILGPGINIKRSPLCGRNFEYFSEDPFLAGEMAAAYVNAVQAQGVGVSLKHFAGNSQETHRQTANSQIDERALREIYLSAFETVVKNAHPATVMASYNRLNGEYACESKRLLTDILRDEWGFDGVVVSDWSACVDLVKCLKAGMDLEMPDSLGIHTEKLRKALQNGEISPEMVLRAAGRINALIGKFAVENRENGAEREISKNHQIAKEIECESAVLLKNDGALPLSRNAHVAVIGALADKIRFQGGGSSHINTRPVKSAVDTLREKGLNVAYASGYRLEDDLPDAELEQQAVALAAKGGTVLFFGGLTNRCEGEGYDRKSLAMPANQLALFYKIAAVNKNIIYVSFSGSPYDIPFESRVRAILHMYLGGEAVAEACADLLTGDANPSGKLAETFPFSVGDTPCSETFATGSDDVEYRESLFVGYRYYEKFGVPVRFPFGHGLSYTAFEYSDLKLSRNCYKGGTLTASFTIRNTGLVRGAEIAQLYVENPDCHYLRAARELRGFAKTELEPNEEKRVSIELSERSFSIYDEQSGRFIMPSGSYKILIGASSEDIRLSSDIAVEGTDYERDDEARLPEYFDKANKLKGISKGQFEALYGRRTSRFDIQSAGDFSVYTSLARLAKHSGLGKFVLKLSEAAVYVIMRDKARDDPAVMMMIEAIKDGTLDLVFCQSGGVLPARLEDAIVFSANGKKLSAVWKLIRG